MSTPGGGLRRSRSGQAPDDRSGGSAGPAAPRRGLLSAGWVGLLGAVLAVAAASVVVLSDDARWLRLAVVAALWAALLGLVVLVRRASAGCGCATEAEAEAEQLRAAYESELSELEGALAARHEYEESLEHDLRLEAAREVEERHSEIAGLRAEVERLQADAEARAAWYPAPVTAAARPPLEPELRTPHQRMTAIDSGPGVRAAAGATDRTAASMPVPPTVPPPVRPARAAWPTAPAAPAPPALVPAPPAPVPTPPAPAPPPAAGRAPIAHPGPIAASSVAERAPAARLPHPPPDRAPVGSTPSPPQSRPSVLDRGSFVDQYVRSAGYDLEPASPPSFAPRPERPTERTPPAPSEVSSTTSGRTVAELLAAHSAAAHSAASRGGPHLHRRPEG